MAHSATASVRVGHGALSVTHIYLIISSPQVLITLSITLQLNHIYPAINKTVCLCADPPAVGTSPTALAATRWPWSLFPSTIFLFCKLCSQVYFPSSYALCCKHYNTIQFFFSNAALNSVHAMADAALRCGERSRNLIRLAQFFLQDLKLASHGELRPSN